MNFQHIAFSRSPSAQSPHLAFLDLEHHVDGHAFPAFFPGRREV
jgi:hypothetical protein